MKTRLMFDQEDVQVYETNNGDPRGKEWYLCHGKIGCSIGFKPEFDPEWIKQYLVEYMNEIKDGLDSQPVDRPITND